MSKQVSFGNVVFTNGHLVDGDTITMYYGASDEVICKAEPFHFRDIKCIKTDTREVMNKLKKRISVL